jgi:putative ABC transport system permease protein
MMFTRLLWKLLRGSRGRLTVALVALISGAAVISALLNLQLDIERKLTQEFRTLGANLVISPAGGMQTADAGSAAPALMDQSAVLAAVSALDSRDVNAAAPFLYVVARAGDTPVVVAGTRLREISKLNPSWKIAASNIEDGSLPSSEEGTSRCLLGRNVARDLHLAPGRTLRLAYLGNAVELQVGGVFDSGAAEDNQVMVELPVAQSLAGVKDEIGLMQLSVNPTATAMAKIEAQLASALPQYQARPIAQVSGAEASLLGRIRLLIASMVILILVLTALCVLATMAALAMERREDVGLMKALGGPISRIVALFLAEVGVLGVVGGFAGCLAGVALSIWMGRRVFGAAISPRWEILPLTVALTTAVALAGALPLRLLGKVKPAAILRGE